MSARRAVTAAAFGLAVVASYAVQRLVDASTEPPLGTVLLQAHIPYYWRVGAAALHGAIVAAAVAVGLDEPRAARVLGALPWVTVAVVVPAAVAMAVVP